MYIEHIQSTFMLFKHMNFFSILRHFFFSGAQYNWKIVYLVPKLILTVCSLVIPIVAEAVPLRTSLHGIGTYAIQDACTFRLHLLSSPFA
ncbi:hypothetical protein BDV26DRAFT_261944 [Aspergillus bertholletiae]|uniref:Uncharacterized protein n=1 Tax=Aspergillus bertholletiae TaxID=1226010 RepID=A0A5N7B8X6_9EURO|nr:hypothetical protein BDV26DRAFT_261944 [Aspergillus bertholletiae]